MLTVLTSSSYSLWQEQAKAEEEACVCSRSDYLSGSGMISVCRRRRDWRKRGSDARHVACGCRESRESRESRARATGHSERFVAAAAVGRGGARESPC